MLRWALDGHRSRIPVDFETRELWREHQYRKLYPGLTHDQYLDEPCEVVDWALAFARMEAEMEEEAMKRAQEKAKHDRG